MSGTGDWVQARDEATGRAYWVNHRTRQTSWQPPEVLSRPLPPSWEVRVDPQSGRTYYVNHANGSTHWEIPESAYQTAPQTASTNGPAPPRPPVQGGEGSPGQLRRQYSQYMPSSAPIEHQRAIQFAECPVCFDSMHSAPSGVFAGADGRRTCAHFFHLRCAEGVRDSSRGGRVCPICRAAFRTVLPVPSPDSDPDGWFRVVDLNGDGRLSQREVLEVLRAQVAVDYGQLEERLPGWWHKWDPQGTGAITQAQLLAEGTGLLHFIRRNLPGAGGAGDASPGGGGGGIPDIRADKKRWFQHFDYDGSGTLEKGEVVRGLIKTFGLGESLERTAQIAETVNAVWGIFDSDGSGTIEMREFMARDGLADTIVASLA